MRSRRLRGVVGVVVAIGLAAACGSGDTTTTGTTTETAPTTDPTPMIVDYSPTLSDVPALMFLATHPDVELLAVTLPGTGESDCDPGVRNTRALLSIAGHPDVPVACGPEQPMTGDRDWPLQFRAAANTVAGVVLPFVRSVAPLDAVDLMADTLRHADRSVTVVTLGPLTNLGYAFEAEPDLAGNVRSVVTMGGAFDVPGNVFDARSDPGASSEAEWNLYIDPQSVRVVLESGVPVTFVPLDATNSVPGELGIFARLSATSATESGEAVRQLWAASLGTERSIAAEWWYFWDELAAVIAVDPTVATISERLVTVDDSGATVERSGGVPALVASAADRDRFEEVFLETFAGGDLPAMQLRSDEERYLETVRSSMVELGRAVDVAFAGVEAQADQVPADELVARLVGGVFDAMETFRDDLSRLEDPERLRPQHEALVAATETFVDSESTYLEALDASAPSEPVGADGFFTLFFETIDAAGLASPFEAFESACDQLDLAALGFGATEALCLE